MSLLEAYAPERFGREWGYRSSDYAGGRHRGLDIRKQNEDQTASVVTDVVAIHDAVVDRVFRPNNKVGLTVVLDRGRGVRGRYEFHSHTADPGVYPGQAVHAGDRLARNAAMWENPGQISGSHDHIVISDYADGAWNTDRPTYDPAPFIHAALAAVAATQARPFTPPPPPKEHSMRTIRWNGKHVLTLGEQQVTHIDNAKYAVNAAIIHNPDGRYVELDDDGLTTALLTFGVPWSAVDACMRGLAYDITGAVGGRFWSRSVEQKIDTSQLAKSLDELRRAAEGLPGPTAAR